MDDDRHWPPGTEPVLTTEKLKAHWRERLLQAAPALTVEEVDRDLQVALDPQDRSRVVISATPGSRVFAVLAEAYPHAVSHEAL